MNTDCDSAPDLHGTSSKLMLKEETRRILGCAFDVLNEVGHGLHEKIYEDALTVAFTLSDTSLFHPCLSVFIRG